MPIKSFRFKSPLEIEEARQFVNNPEGGAAQLGAQIARSASSPADAFRKTISLLRSAVEELESRSKIQDKIHDIDQQIHQVKGEAKKLEEMNRRMDELLPTIMAMLGDDSKEPCDPSSQVIAVRTAELTRLLGRFESKTTASPANRDLSREALLKKLRAMLRAVPELFRHAVQG